jgi:phosphoribosylformimino-5-aminoimidazole carboxamide ribotide isomerase
MDAAAVVNSDSTAQARTFEAQGFEELHVIDLDAVVAGKPVNTVAIEAILAAVTIPVQLGGGIRDMATVEAWLSKGVNRLLIGTAAIQDPTFVRLAAQHFPSRIAVGIDARQGELFIGGRSRGLAASVIDIARQFEGAGVAAIVYNDLHREGTLRGLDLRTGIALAEAVSIPVIVGGGIGSIEDVVALLQPGAERIFGAIVGRAIYERQLDVQKALALIKLSRS